MRIYEAGREASLLEEIKAGRKTVECRLDRGQYKEYQPGDQIWIRADHWQDGKIIKSEPKQVLLEIDEVERFPNFKTMFEKIGFKDAIPTATSADEALAVCHLFYTPAEEAECGVLAVHFHLIRND